MPIYLAIPLKTDSSPLNRAVSEKIDELNRFKLQSDRGWLISFPGTSTELCKKLEITGQEKGVASPVGAALVAPFTSYFGRGSNEMWEWLKTRFEGNNGG